MVGAAHTLQEILTVKSDDVVGRVKVYESIVKGQQIDQAGVPESFRVLMKEFQALGLDISIINDKGENLQLKEIENAEEEENKPLIDEIDAPIVPVSENEEELNEDYSDEEEFEEEDIEVSDEEIMDLEEEGADL